MSTNAYIDIIAGTGQVIKSDIWATVDEQLHEHSPELGEILIQLIREKTPILTGALISDISAESYPDPGGYELGDSDLTWVYAAPTAQMAFWERIYVPYVEGGPLGLPTYTNDPRVMFLQTAESDGLVATIVWATTWIEYALLLCASGAGVPF